jgi:hypothetical protein
MKGRTKHSHRGRVIVLLVVLAGAGGVGASLCGNPPGGRADESRAHAAARPAESRGRRLGRFSRSHPPEIARPESGALVSVREIEPAFARYRQTLCQRVAVNATTVPDHDALLGLALSEAAPASLQLVGSLSEGDVPRRAAPDVAEWLGDFDLRAAEPCLVLAVIELLTIWPEAEPGDLLAALAGNPPGGSIFMTLKALGAMGETGRADYADLAARFVDPANDARVVARAIRTAAVITGDAELAATLASDEAFPMDDSLAGELAGALTPAAGPGLDRTMRALLRSQDPFRQEAGLKAAAIGVGMPAALPRVLEAAAGPHLSMEAARSGVDAIRAAMPGSAAATLLDLARSPAASPDARAAAITAIGDAPIDVAVEVASRGPTPFMAIQLAAHAERIHEGSARRILEALAATSIPKESLVEAIRGAEDEALIRAGLAVFPDPGLWD